MKKEEKTMCTSKLEQIVSCAKYRLDIINTDIENYNERMRRDYEHFFRWYADNLYTLHIRKNYYTQLMLTNTGDVEEMRLYLKEKISTFTIELLEGELLLTRAPFNGFSQYRKRLIGKGIVRKGVVSEGGGLGGNEKRRKTFESSSLIFLSDDEVIFQ